MRAVCLPSVRQILATGLVVSSLFLHGCEKKLAKNPSGAGGAAPPPAQVSVAIAKRQPVSETLSLVGSLAANEMVEIKSETEGTVEAILFQEGQPVKQGELLLRLDESKFAAALAEAEANFKLSRVNYERNQQLLKDKLISQHDHDQTAALYQANLASVELKKRQMRDARILAPFAGIAGARSISPGQVIGKNTTLAWLVDLDIVKIEFALPERFLSQTRVGQSLELKVAAFPGEKFKGEVYFIAPLVEAATRTVLIKARIANTGQKLKPGMFANLDLTLRIKEAAVVIPETALMLNGDRASIYIVGEDQTAQIRPVKTGIRLTGEVEIVSGLQGGEKVIYEGHQKFGPGRKVVALPADSGAPVQPGRATNAPAAK